MGEVFSLKIVKRRTNVSISSTSISEFSIVKDLKSHCNSLTKNFFSWMEKERIKIIRHFLPFNLKLFDFVIPTLSSRQSQNRRIYCFSLVFLHVYNETITQPIREFTEIIIIDINHMNMAMIASS